MLHQRYTFRGEEITAEWRAYYFDKIISVMNYFN